jgi:hypothetical protein
VTARAARAEGDRVHFWCPGCDQAHGIRHGDPSTSWTWNGDLERPTFRPSVLVRGGPNDDRCHSFVTDGRIAFLGDCSHELAGKTVDLPAWPHNDDDGGDQ